VNVTKRTAADKIAAYLRHEITLGELVDWSERAVLDGEFSKQEAKAISDVVSRLGVADVRAFDLTWEDCQELLNKLGFAARVEVVSA
jgi:hypothetical protein